MNKYLALFFYSAKRTLLKPWSFLGSGILLITCLIIFFRFWEVINVDITSNAENKFNILWYLTFNEWIILAIPSPHLDIENDLHSGAFNHRLINPISYLGLKFYEGLGQLIINLIFLAIISFSFTAFLLQGLPFTDLLSWCSFIFISILAGCIALVFQIIVGLLAFWFQDVMPYYWIWEKMLFIFGGLLFPLSIYPSLVKKLSYCTPFSAILAIRSSIVFDSSLNHFIQVFAALVFWGILGVSLMIFVFSKAISKFLLGRT